MTAGAGVRYCWWEGDLRRALRERRGGLIRDLAGSLHAGVGAVHSVGRWRDPGPALTQAQRLLAEHRGRRRNSWAASGQSGRSTP